MDNMDNFLKKYFKVLLQSQTYLNLVYLLLSFPLGLFYFVFLVTGVSVGVATLILVVGILILAAVFAASWALTAFERVQAITLLRVKIPPMDKPIEESAGFWTRLKAYFTNPVTWKGLLFLFSKFPLGVINFTLVVTVFAVVLALVAAPLAYPWATYDLGFTVINSLSDALLVMIVGLLLAPAGFHLLNFLTRLQGEYARVMLGQSSYESGQSIIPAPSQVSDTETPAGNSADNSK